MTAFDDLCEMVEAAPEWLQDADADDPFWRLAEKPVAVIVRKLAELVCQRLDEQDARLATIERRAKELGTFVGCFGANEWRPTEPGRLPPFGPPPRTLVEWRRDGEARVGTLVRDDDLEGRIIRKVWRWMVGDERFEWQSGDEWRPAQGEVVR